jgi:hypothetical protein
MGLTSSQQRATKIHQLIEHEFRNPTKVVSRFLDIYTNRHNLTKFGSKLILETIHKSQGKRETNSLDSARTWRPSRAQRAPELAAQPNEGARDARPTRERSPGGGDRKCCQRKCDLAPELTAIYTTKLFTIPTDRSYARTPFTFPILASGRSPMPLRTLARR